MSQKKLLPNISKNVTGQPSIATNVRPQRQQTSSTKQNNSANLKYKTTSPQSSCSVASSSNASSYTGSTVQTRSTESAGSSCGSPSSYKTGTTFTRASSRHSQAGDTVMQEADDDTASLMSGTTTYSGSVSGSRSNTDTRTSLMSGNGSYSSCNSNSNSPTTGSRGGYASTRSHSSYTTTNTNNSSVQSCSSSCFSSTPTSPNSSYSSSVEEIKSEEFLSCCNNRNRNIPVHKDEPQIEAPVQVEASIADEDGSKKCLWNRCEFAITAAGNENDDDMNSEIFIEHIKSKHIYSQSTHTRYRCMWQGCQVYKIPSCSFNWLERHVIDHIDTKPFVCIFKGCKRKFRTEQALERHVQSHISSNTGTPALSSAMASTGGGQAVSSLSSAFSAAAPHSSPIKTRNHMLLKSVVQSLKNKSKNNLNVNTTGNNRKKTTLQTTTNDGTTTSKLEPITNVTANYSQILKNLARKRRMQNNNENVKKFKKAQYKDYIDPSTTEVLRYKLACLNYSHQLSADCTTCGWLTFKAQVIASQLNQITGVEKFLVEWFPKNIIQNEWVEKDKLCATKQVELSKLFRKKFPINNNCLYRTHRFRPSRRK